MLILVKIHESCDERSDCKFRNNTTVNRFMKLAAFNFISRTAVVACCSLEPRKLTEEKACELPMGRTIIWMTWICFNSYCSCSWSAFSWQCIVHDLAHTRARAQAWPVVEKYASFFICVLSVKVLRKCSYCAVSCQYAKPSHEYVSETCVSCPSIRLYLASENNLFENW